MTIIDEIIETLSKCEENIFTSSEIKDLVSDKYRRNKDSILPSDYCYNRTNKGVEFKRQILIRLGENEYKFVGENYPYSGWIYQKEQGRKTEDIVGQWENGRAVLFTKEQLTPCNNEHTSHLDCTELNLQVNQIKRLYEEYIALLELEINVFGCKPTETRHLIGRIGEFKCALTTKGHLARKTNQHGFDVISNNGNKISVKTTAQKNGFVAINSKTCHFANELMVIQYTDNDFKIIYYGAINEAINASRVFGGKYEFDISKAKQLQKKNRPPSE